MSSGAGVAGVRIQLLNLDARVIRRTFTDASGQFDFADLPAGTYVAREAAQRGVVERTSFLGGVVVGVHDIDPATGGPYPPVNLLYVSIDTVLTAGAIGRVVGPGLGPSVDLGPDPAVYAFALRREVYREYLDPLAAGHSLTNILGIVRGGLAGGAGLASVL